MDYSGASAWSRGGPLPVRNGMKQLHLYRGEISPGTHLFSAIYRSYNSIYNYWVPTLYQRELVFAVFVGIINNEMVKFYMVPSRKGISLSHNRNYDLP